jgi:hypothetical protein
VPPDFNVGYRLVQRHGCGSKVYRLALSSKDYEGGRHYRPLHWDAGGVHPAGDVPKYVPPPKREASPASSESSEGGASVASDPSINGPTPPGSPTPPESTPPGSARDTANA